MRFGTLGRKRIPGFAGWAAVAILALPMVGCQLIGGSGAGTPGNPPPSDRQGGVVYHGSLILDGGEVPAGLEIGVSGGKDAWGALETTTGLRADGVGRVRGDHLELSLAYEGDCPGTMVLEGTWDREGGSYRGTVEASDCTGAAFGTFFFTVG
jgi:hypothetical protein